MLAMLAIPVANRMMVVMTAAITRTQRTTETGRHHRGASVAGMLLAVVLVVPVAVRHVVARRSRDPLLGLLDHLVAIAERDGLGRAHLRARGVLADLDAVGAERAFVDGRDDAVEVELRHHERTRLHAVPVSY